MASYRTEGIVLRTFALGEADQILTLFTETMGKVRAVARGSKRPRNQLIGSSQLFVHGSFVIYRGKNLDSISQSMIINPMLYLRENLVKMAYASFMVELIDALTEEYDSNGELFELLLLVLGKLREDGLEPRLLLFFQFHTLRLIGIGPELTRCVCCGEAVATQAGEALGFSWQEGGVLCSNCYRDHTDALRVSPGALMALRWFADAKAERLGILQTTSRMETEIDRLLTGSVDYFLQKPLKSREFLNIIRE